MLQLKSWGLLALLCAGCGGRSESGDGASGLARCGQAASCGGDLTGSWSIESYCTRLEDASGLLAGGSAPECDAEFQRAVNDAVVTPIDARLDFDGTTYGFSGTAAMSFQFAYTDACFRALSGVSLDASRCAQVSESYQTNPDYDGSCSYSGSACHCSLSSVIDLDEIGSYEVADGQVFVDGYSIGGPYCVEGNGATVDFVSPEAEARLQLRR